MPTDDGFLREGLRRWGRAHLLTDTFEDKLKETLIAFGDAAASKLGIMGATSAPYVWGRTRDGSTIGVEIKGRVGKKAALLYLGVEWVGDQREPRYFAGIDQPAEFKSLQGRISEQEIRNGVQPEKDGKLDYLVLDVGERTIKDGLGLLIATLARLTNEASR